MRYSKQREVILEDVQNRYDHPTAYDIYETVKTVIPDISLATVYRNLKQLSENGLVNQVEVANDNDRFDSTLDTHAHFVCSCCKECTDVPKMSSKEVMKYLDKNFVIESINIVIKGICDKCKEN